MIPTLIILVFLLLGIEGRAGMACIADAEYEVDLIHLRSELLNKIPHYARPQFLRLASVENLTQTETFKFKKVKLRDEGFDPRNVLDDRLYYNNQQTGRFEVLDILADQQIVNHVIRF